MGNSLGTNLENSFRDTRFSSLSCTDSGADSLPKLLTREELNAAINARAALYFEQSRIDAAFLGASVLKQAIDYTV